MLIQTKKVSKSDVPVNATFRGGKFESERAVLVATIADAVNVSNDDMIYLAQDTPAQKFNLARFSQDLTKLQKDVSVESGNRLKISTSDLLAYAKLNEASEDEIAEIEKFNATCKDLGRTKLRLYWICK